jgi:Anaphase-promoting complex, cyclosome, subunit 3
MLTGLSGQAYYVNKQYRRAHALMNKPELFARNMRYRYLAAMCMAECQEWETCLATIGEEDIPETLAEQVLTQNLAGKQRPSACSTLDSPELP